MSFTKPGPFSGYVTGDLIDEADINYWCAALPDCIDGAGGGTYTLTAPLIINGDDIEFGENLIVIGDVVIDGDTTIGSTSGDALSVAATSTFVAPASFTGNVTIGTDATDTFISNSTVFFHNGPVKFDTLTTRHVNGFVTLEDCVLEVSGTGRITTTYAPVTSTLTTVDVTQCRQIYIAIGSGGSTALSGTPVEGDWVRITNATAFTQTLTGIIAGSMFTKTGIMWIYSSGAWHIGEQWAVP